ncbi:acyl-CoA dehydrogenase family protein [Loktanella sp. S4079]|uniref:acyl-CoA dehydrogenase family protein n=1 Tax=Loktanella sp. S4079 TaxID=579483 RepID=UPI000A50408B|nr:acyl-CoA dehydrogenase family protein [Loktanella sp. S4079]
MTGLAQTTDETMLVESARSFIDQAAPVSHLRGLRDAGKTYDPDLWAQMVAMGWAGVLIPENAGGSDMGFTAACLLSQEMGKTLASSPFISTAVIAATVFRHAARDKSQKALKEIASGHRIYAMAIDERGKFAPEQVRTYAKSTDKGYELSGSKVFVVDGGFANRLLILARTDEGLTLFDIAADATGVEISPNSMIDSRNAANITLDQVALKSDAIVGSAGKAMKVLAPALHAGQAAVAAEATGLAIAAFDMTIAYLKERTQFGVKIGSFQALQHRAAHLWCEIEATRSALMNAGRVLDQSPQDAGLAVSLAKARAMQTARLAVSEGVQMHGGIGMTDEFDMGFYMKRARVLAEWLGDYGYHAEKIAQARGL